MFNHERLILEKKNIIINIIIIYIMSCCVYKITFLLHMLCQVTFKLSDLVKTNFLTVFVILLFLLH